MSSIFSTQKRQTFLRRKYAFFCVATALSPPVGRCPALPGLPLNSGMGSPYASFGPDVGASLGRPGMAGAGAPSPIICCATEGCGAAGAAMDLRCRSEEHTSELQSPMYL